MRVHRDGQWEVRPRGRLVALALGALLLLAGVARAEEPLAAPPDAGIVSPEGAAPEPGVTVAALAVPAPTGRTPGAPEQTAVERAWRAPAESLEERTERTRRAALEVGAWNLDPAARALIRGVSEGTPLERAMAAVQLAPDLPASHLALARALWLYENDAMAAIVAVVDGVRAIGHHPEASLWFAGSGLYITAVALLAASLLLLALTAVLSAPHAAHDVAHLLRVRVPPFAGFALLGALLLLPLLLGEGILGLACVLIVIGMLYGSGARRFALLLVALALYAGLYTVPQLAAAALAALPDDPVARAAYSVGQGQASPVDLARLERASADDPLAVRALAIHARQLGHLGQADAYYQQLLEDSPNDLALVNNAANVRLDLGHVDSALELYDRALELAKSPVVLFNLSQAYGRSFQVDELNRTLAEAQETDGEMVAEFTSLQRTKNQSFVVDFPLSTRQLWRRVLANPGGDTLARSFRHPLAPGRLGASPKAGGLALALAVGLAWILSTRFEPSRSCVRCGGRQCGRCGDGGGRELCESCNRLFFEPEKTDRRLRVERIEALRERELRMGRLRTVVSVLVPGAAGLLVKRPLRGLIGAFCFALAACAVIWRGGVVPDPLLAGPAAGVVFLGSAGVCAFLYIASVASSLAAGREL